MDASAAARLGELFAKIGLSLRDKRKRASFAMYAFGILGAGERKSAEPSSSAFSSVKGRFDARPGDTGPAASSRRASVCAA